MKKTYPLQRPGKHPDRVLDAIKHETRQYMKRERAKPLAAGAHFLDFDCKFGATEAEAVVVHVGDLAAKMDEAALGGAEQFYVEIVAKPSVRQQRIYGAPDSAAPPAHQDGSGAGD
jgi:hypothetical protein